MYYTGTFTTRLDGALVHMGTGRIVIPSHIDIWPHELETARALAASGRDIEFLRRISGDNVKSADIVMEGVTWEMKAPQTDAIKRLERIVRRASQQSSSVIIDTTRAKKLSDAAIERELRKIAPLNKRLRRLLLVTKSRKVIDIK